MAAEPAAKPASESVDLWLTENGTLTTAELSTSQAMVLRERYGDYLAVQPGWEPGVFVLTARQTIGIIVLDGLRIHITPKVPLTNLFYMLTYAYDLPLFRDEEAPLAVGDELFEFLVEIFVKQVDGLARQGIYRGYVDIEEDVPYLRGRLLLGEHLRRNVIQPTRFAQRTNDFTADRLENRILKATLWQLAGAPYRDPELRRRVRRALSAFSEVKWVAVRPEMCGQVVYNRLNARYRTPIHLAQLFLRHLSLEGRVGDTPFMSYLLPMAEVFERFVARYLAQHFAAHPRISVRAQESIWLDEAFRERGRLDILLRWAGQPVMILDTKYKTFDGAPSESDRNQIFMYCHALRVSRAMLVYADARPVDYEARFPGVWLAARSLALDGTLAEFRQRCWGLATGLMEDVSGIA
jgi:5-methylcytosine-specific restriction enzyme subunit McrC